MSTELIKVESTGLNLFDPVVFETVQRMCNLYASSDLVPDQYRIKNPADKNKPIANCMIALNMAHRINADPLMVMQNLYIVHGKPSWSSKFLIATINSCGRFDALKYKTYSKGKIGKVGNVDYKDLEDLCCVAYTSVKGSKEVLEGSEISIRMAIEEGWYNKNGSKWRTIPDQMLKYRAASFWCSVYAPELSMGIRTQEEVIDIEHEEITSTHVKPNIPTDANSLELKILVDEETGEVAEETKPADSEGSSDPATLFSDEQPAFQ